MEKGVVKTQFSVGNGGDSCKNANSDLKGQWFESLNRRTLELHPLIRSKSAGNGGAGGGKLGQNYQSVLDSNNTKNFKVYFLSTLTSILSVNVTMERSLSMSLILNRY